MVPSVTQDSSCVPNGFCQKLLAEPLNSALFGIPQTSNADILTGDSEYPCNDCKIPRSLVDHKRGLQAIFLVLRHNIGINQDCHIGFLVSGPIFAYLIT